jgi:hypothetical protein
MPQDRLYDCKTLGNDLTPRAAACWSTIPNLDEQSSKIRSAFLARILEISVVCLAARAATMAAAGVVSAKGYGKCLCSISYTASVVANCGDDRITLNVSSWHTLCVDLLTERFHP